MCIDTREVLERTEVLLRQARPPNLRKEHHIEQYYCIASSSSSDPDMRMARCMCSARALELFVANVAGINLRLPGRSRTLLSTRRSYSTQPRVQHVQTASVGTTETFSTPFESSNDAGGLCAERQDRKKPQEAIEADKGDAAWHAEATIIGPGLDQPISAGRETLPEQSAAAGSESTSYNAIAPEDTSEPGARPRETPKQVSELRKLRKQRRQQDGSYKPNGRVESALAKIAAFEGPELKAGKPKQLDAESHKVAKKAKYDKMIADKAAAKAKAELVQRTLKKETWQIQKAALEDKFGEAGWKPRKRLSPDTLEGIRAVHASDPASYSTEILSDHFKVTPEAIRRILKSKWKASEDEVTDRRIRWERRGVKKWEELAKLGVRPPAKWRAMGIGSEKGTKTDRVPKRHARLSDDGQRELTWDEVVADVEGGEGIAARIL